MAQFLFLQEEVVESRNNCQYTREAYHGLEVRRVVITEFSVGTPQWMRIAE